MQAFAKNVCHRQLRLLIGNTDEMKVLQQVKIDFSSLLLHKCEKPNSFEICVV